MYMNISFFLVALVATCLSQEMSPKTIMTWLPTGLYHSISVTIHEDLRSSTFFAVMDESLTRSFTTGEDSSIPTLLRSDMTLEISAELFPKDQQFSLIGDEENERPDAKKETKSGGGRNSLLGLAIYAMDDVGGTMKQAIAAGVARESGQHILRKPVWRFPLSKPNEKEHSVWAWDTGTGELLVADTLPLLHQMVAAGSGRGPSIVDDPDLHDHLSRIPPEAVRWFYRSYAAIWERTMDDFRAMGEQGKADQLREVYDAKPQYELAWFEFRADGVLQARAWGFTDSGPAEKFIESLQASLGSEQIPKEYPTAAVAFNDALRQKTTYRLNGSLAIWETFYDEEVLAKMDAAREALKTWRAEQEKIERETDKPGEKSQTPPPQRH